MSETSTIVRHKLSEVLVGRARGHDETRADAPEAESLGEAFWARADVAAPRSKTSVHLRVDSDVLAWFKAPGRGHLTRMNAVLRAYVEAQKR